MKIETYRGGAYEKAKASDAPDHEYGPHSSGEVPACGELPQATSRGGLPTLVQDLAMCDRFSGEATVPHSVMFSQINAARIAERARCAKIARDAREQAAADECGRMDGECCVSWMEHVAAKIEAGE